MAEIAAIIAVVIALGALFLASQAFKQAGGSFDDFTKKMIKHVRDAQSEFAKHADGVEKRAVSMERDVQAIDATSRDHAEKINTLTQRVKVLEHELQSLTDSIPKQYRRNPTPRDNKSAQG